MNQLSYGIRRATEADLPAIQALNQKLFEKEVNDYDDTLKVSWPQTEDGERYFRNIIINGYAVVAEVEDGIVGYLAGSINARSYCTTRCGEIDNIFVDQEFRNFGIGTVLVENFLQYCKDQGIRQVKVTAYFANSQAIDFYKNSGFSEYELTLKKEL